LFVIKKPKYGPVNNIAKKGFIWKIVNTGITHIKKCNPMLGVNQYFPGARNLTFQAMCLFPENEHVFLPHKGSFLLSHSSSSLTKNNRLTNNKPAKNDIYKNIKFGLLVNANNHILKNSG
jgi:hypothetical protein